MSVGTVAPNLHQYLPDDVAYLCDLTLACQREWEGFGLWYHDMLEHTVFGTEDDLIIIDE